MKTKFFAALNIITLFITISFLEFDQSSYGKWVVLGGMTLFIVSGILSIFKRDIWKTAHSKHVENTYAFLSQAYKLVPAFIVTIVVSMSIVSDIVGASRNLMVFTSHLVVYTAVALPCHLAIFRPQLVEKTA